MTDAQNRIERAEELDRGAAPGPWTATPQETEELTKSWGLSLAGPRSRDNDHSLAAMEPGDALFIAESRTLLPALTADLEKTLAQLAEAQKEIESLQERLEILASNLRNCEQNSLRRQAKLSQAERDKAALREGIKLYRDFVRYGASLAPGAFQWEREHGALVPASDPAAALQPREGEAEKAQPVCKCCNDTHRVWLEESGHEINCRNCPRPCPKCDGRNGYCTKTPCPCDCHPAAGAEILAAHRDTKTESP